MTRSRVERLLWRLRSHPAASAAAAGVLGVLGSWWGSWTGGGRRACWLGRLWRAFR